MAGHRIELAWQNYAVRVGVQAAGPVWRKELRRAFYCGAEAIFLEVLRGIDAGEDTGYIANDLPRLDGLHRELTDFNAAVRRGEA